MCKKMTYDWYSIIQSWFRFFNVSCILSLILFKSKIKIVQAIQGSNNSQQIEMTDNFVEI